MEIEGRREGESRLLLTVPFLCLGAATSPLWSQATPTDVQDPSGHLWLPSHLLTLFNLYQERVVVLPTIGESWIASWSPFGLSAFPKPVY